MKVQKQSLLTGKLNSMDINVSTDALARIRDGESMRKIVPHLTLSECEFLNSGCTPDEMNQLTQEENTCLNPTRKAWGILY